MRNLTSVHRGIPTQLRAGTLVQQLSIIDASKFICQDLSVKESVTQSDFIHMQYLFLKLAQQNNFTRSAAEEILSILQNPSSPIPGLKDESMHQAIVSTAKLLNRITKKFPKAPVSPPFTEINPFVAPPPRVRKQKKNQSRLNKFQGWHLRYHLLQ